MYTKKLWACAFIISATIQALDTARLNPRRRIINNDIIGAYRVMAGRVITPELFVHIKFLCTKLHWSHHDLALYLASREEVRNSLDIHWLPVPTPPTLEPTSDERTSITIPPLPTDTSYTDKVIIGAYRVMAGKPITPSDFEICKKYRPILPRFLLILDDTISNLRIPPLDTIETFPIQLPSGLTIFGYKSDKFIAQALAKNGRWESYMEAVMRKVIKPGHTAIDVGANIGYYTAVFAQCVGNDGKVFAFEPLSPLVSLLERFKAFNELDQVSIYAYALSDRSEKIYIKINPISPGVSHSVDPLSIAHYEAQMPGCIAHVAAIPLDKVLKTRLERFDFLKIDVEGMEDLVLKGADTLIKQFHPIIIWELNPHAYEQRKVSTLDFLHYFEEQGYVMGIVQDLADTSDPIQAVQAHPLTGKQILDYLARNKLHQIDIILVPIERKS